MYMRFNPLILYLVQLVYLRSVLYTGKNQEQYIHGINLIQYTYY